MGRKRKRLHEIELNLKNTIKPKASAVKESICSKTCWSNAVTTLSLVLIYYVFSISLTFYNKKFITVSTQATFHNETICVATLHN